MTPLVGQILLVYRPALPIDGMRTEYAVEILFERSLYQARILNGMLSVRRKRMSYPHLEIDLIDSRFRDTFLGSPDGEYQMFIDVVRTPLDKEIIFVNPTGNPIIAQSTVVNKDFIETDGCDKAQVTTIILMNDATIAMNHLPTTRSWATGTALRVLMSTRRGSYDWLLSLSDVLSSANAGTWSDNTVPPRGISRCSGCTQTLCAS